MELNIDWIEKLARAEEQLERSDHIDFHAYLDDSKVVEAETIGFLNVLREKLSAYVEAFNALRAGSNTIKIFRISGTAAEFMLFRNSLKLIFANPRVGVIHVRFTSLAGGAYTRLLKNKEEEPLDGDALEAQIGPFNEVFWTYRGQRVDATFLVKHYLTEFIKNSSR
jgi:hypothetical protein